VGTAAILEACDSDGRTDVETAGVATSLEVEAPAVAVAVRSALRSILMFV
jgi:hypothetical protein